VSAALVVQHANGMRAVAMSRSTIFFHIISQTARLSGKIMEYKICVLTFSTNFVRNISHSKKN
jgi:hypothetical protein